MIHFSALAAYFLHLLDVLFIAQHSDGTLAHILPARTRCALVCCPRIRTPVRCLTNSPTLSGPIHISSQIRGLEHDYP